ncbi:MAG: hypothetical protein AAF386_08655 [Pseudomonadota bacterium]
MGFPFDAAAWAPDMEAIFPGAGGSMPGVFALIGIVVCIGALVVGQMAESAKYKKHK